MFEGKRIVLGVTGSIAAYKSVDLASKLTQAGAEVDVVLTSAAEAFVTPLTFRSVTGRPAFADMWQTEEHVRHVGLGEKADLMVIAPATANTIAKLANGLADNLLTVTALALRGALLLAPAMDGGMYSHPAVQANIAALLERGVRLAGPEEGRMASGLTGLGRMSEPSAVLAAMRLLLGESGPLAGRKVVVTTGPTREPLDPVRFISNRSSGKQGLAVAQTALDNGADVTLIAGPISEPIPAGLTLVPVTTSEQMAEATCAATVDADVLFMVAAVADFRPGEVSDRKLKKTETDRWGLAIGLEPTLDILTQIKARRDETGFPRVVVGFAAETHDAYEYGRDKLLRKGLDFIVVNDVLSEGAGFAVDTNEVTIITADGSSEALPLLSKAAVAERLVQRVAEHIVGAESQQ